MATIDLNNLIRPKQVNYSGTSVTQKVNTSSPVYIDLHLDLTIAQSIGVGVSPAIGNDVLVDNNIKAIQNSIRNIFTTKQGEKVLNPTFGCSLEQFLFEPVSDIGGKAIGDLIYNSLVQYEPRITVNKVYVQPNPTSTSNFLKLLNNENKVSVLDSKDYGAGYGISIVYSINEINVEANSNLIALLGGQILF